jgi:type IV pilus assembly protein PilP
MNIFRRRGRSAFARRQQSFGRMRAVAGAALAAVLLGGCGDSEHEDLRQWMREASKDLRGNITPLPQVRPYEPVKYDAADLRSPFDTDRVRVVGGSTGGAAPDLNRPREPLEEFPLETMKFVGFFQDRKRLIAQVLVNGKTYEVRTGNYIGQNFGRVTQIATEPNEERIVLKEVVQEPDGAWVERDSELLLSGAGGQR